MISIMEAFWNWGRGIDWHVKKSQKDLQEKFDRGEPGGVDIKGWEERAKFAQKIQKNRIEPLEKENQMLREKISNQVNNQVNNQVKDVDKDQSPGFFSKAAKAVIDTTPYVAAAGVGAYGLKKYLDKRRQQSRQQSIGQQQANYPV
jgi:uncharacterized protein (UPF0335 family)